MNPLTKLHNYGQSVWFDQMRRSLLKGGELGRMIEKDGLRGVTSNPTIFEKAIGGSADYDEALKELASSGASVEEIYASLVVEDIKGAADLFRPLYDESNAVDGYISLEVSPTLAHDTAGTIESAKKLFQALDRPNVMIKIPATPEGLPAIEEVIATGINVNVTLIFSQAVYVEVAESYIRGLERRVEKGESVDRIASVASFFVSRIDAAIDKQLGERIAKASSEDEKGRLRSLLGKAAVANAKLAYQKYKGIFEGARFAELKAQGAQAQRQLWASTGTKNPKYSDVLYVESLIGADTVNTVPPDTLNAFRDHGRVRATLEEDVEGAREYLRQLAEVGISLDSATKQLTTEGVKSFADSFTKLITVIEARRDGATRNLLERQTANLGKHQEAFEQTLERMEKEKFIARMWRKDATLWTESETDAKIIRNALGWLPVVEMMSKHVDELMTFADEIKQEGFTRVVVLGMGGSSLCPEVFRRSFGKREGYPELLVLDSTVPEAIQNLEAQIDSAKTLFIVASKSGTTTEPQMFHRYFYGRVKEIKADAAGENFIAITDPDTQLGADAGRDKFRRVFENPADIGGRYSALSYFGIVPAALMGIDVKILLDRALHAVHACSEFVPVKENPGARLAAILGTLAQAGRDKVTLVTPAPLDSLGLWIEQLVAESTGKEGKGIVPVAGEPLDEAEVYGDDRVFVLIRTQDASDAETEAKLKSLEDAGHPVIRHTLHDALDLGEEFFIWEFAVGLTGALLGINSFDQPNVQESKDNTKQLLEEFRSKGKLTAPEALSAEGSLKIYAAAEAQAALAASSVDEVIRKHLARVKSYDYVAVTAYIAETSTHDEAIQAIRTIIRDSLKVATTVGYGPRFLHSTGQLHKGGADNGVFIQITADDKEDLAIPHEPFTFGVLKQAQALGDFASLASRDRRAIRFHLGADTQAGLERLRASIQKAVVTKGERHVSTTNR